MVTPIDDVTAEELDRIAEWAKSEGQSLYVATDLIQRLVAAARRGLPPADPSSVYPYTIPGHPGPEYFAGLPEKYQNNTVSPSPQGDAGLPNKEKFVGQDIAGVKRLGEPDEGYPFVRAAFINAIAEEGTKAEAVEWLQKEWNARHHWHQKASRLAAALQILCAEVSGLPAFERELREAIGNTNYNVLIEKLHDARSALGRDE
jgi:hypothetical protein